MRVRGKHEYDLPPEINNDQIPGVHVTSADPTFADNSSSGYYAGYIWLGTSSGGAFICESSSVGTASWTQFDGAGGAGFSEVSKNSGSVINLAPRTNLNFIEGSNISLTISDDSGGDEVDITIASTGGGSSRISATVSTTNATPTVITTVSTLTDNETNIIEVYIKAYQASAAQYGVWKRTLTVTKVSGTPVIQLVNADVTKTSSGLRSSSVTFGVSAGNITVSVTGIAATTINWKSAYEIIL
jgi:hypothetical protein